MRYRGKLIVLVAGFVLMVAIAGTASGTPPVGSATTIALNTGTVNGAVNMPANVGVKLITTASVDVVQTNSTAAAGWSSGWHSHNGPVIVSIKSGTLTVYSSACAGVTYGPGQAAGSAFVEPPNRPVLARNEGTTSVEWFTTQIIPTGSATRNDVSPGLCGLL